MINPFFRLDIRLQLYKVECVFPLVISSEFRMRLHRDGDHQEDAPTLSSPHYSYAEFTMGFLTGFSLEYSAIICNRTLKADSTAASGIARRS